MGKLKTLMMLIVLALIFTGTVSFAAENGPAVGTGSTLSGPAASYTEGKQYESFALGYMDLLGNVRTDLSRIRDLFENTDVSLYNVIVADVTGDRVPEMIFATLEDEQGSVALTMAESMEYTHKIVIHIVSFDQASGSVLFLKDYDAICFDDQGNFRHFGIWPGAFYVIPDNNSIYYRQGASWSGMNVLVEEYAFDESSNSLVMTYDALVGAAGVPEEDITSPGAALVFARDESALLLTDAYGNSGFYGMLPEDAIEYLKTAEIEEELPENGEIQSVTVDWDISIPEDLEPYKKAYAALLMSIVNASEEGSGPFRNVAIDNVYGDETPELICVMKDLAGSGEKVLYIFSYSDGNIVQVCSLSWENILYSDRYCYYLFRIKDDDTLYIYKNIGSGSWIDESYSSLEENQTNGMHEDVIFEKIVDISGSEDEGYYARRGVQIPSWDYDIGIKQYTEQMDQVLLIDYAGWDYDDNYVGEHANEAMTCRQAVEYLISGTSE